MVREWPGARQRWLFGFALAVLAGAALVTCCPLGWARARGLHARARPVSNLIDTPNWFSFLVAALAGVVGVISLTEARSI